MPAKTTKKRRTAVAVEALLQRKEKTPLIKTPSSLAKNRKRKKARNLTHPLARTTSNIFELIKKKKRKKK